MSHKEEDFERLEAIIADLVEALEQLSRVVTRDSTVVAMSLEKARFAIARAKSQPISS